ncbi:TPA: hypothetical protein DEP90_00090 [Patescibacteria group bacterium]|nr:hypothetical protein [Patescibacteria group bacterium]
MFKDFDEWNKLKKNIQIGQKIRYFRAREIWWCHIGANIGYEQDGKGRGFSRPILILNSYNRNLLLAVPISSKIKDKNRYYQKISYNNKIYSVIISQIRLLDSKRLIRKIATLNKEDFENIKKYVRSIM